MVKHPEKFSKLLNEWQAFDDLSQPFASFTWLPAVSESIPEIMITLFSAGFTSRIIR